MQVCHRVRDLRAAIKADRAARKVIGFVPTMGNLHDGHIQLVRRAKEVCDSVVVSIFVNPLQFGENEDLGNYPRTLEADKNRLIDEGISYLFCPTVEEMYPNGVDTQTQVYVPELSEKLCGASRSGHFLGVTTVVCKLFNMVQPDLAVFGEKDFQQLAIIRRMVTDLCLPVDIVGVPTMREADGLAMSSRNGYLTPAERELAPQLQKILSESVASLEAGQRDTGAIEQHAWLQLQRLGFEPDYVAVRNVRTLEKPVSSDRELVILAAAYLGNTRLIDNVTVTLNLATN